MTPFHVDPPNPPAAEAEVVHRRITDRLAALLPAPGQPPHPYLRRYLARHAALGDVLDDTHLPAGFLPWETSAQIRGLLGLPITDDPRHTTLADWTGIEPFLTDADPASRALSLRFAHLANHHHPPPAQPADLLQPRWAHWRTTNNVIASTHAPITALTAFAGVDGRTLLATGGDDATVRIWDPASGAAVGDPLTGHTGPVGAITAFAGVDGRTLLATGGSDATVRIWDPASGAEITRLVTAAPMTGFCVGSHSHERQASRFLALAGPAGVAVVDIASNDITSNTDQPDHPAET